MGWLMSTIEIKVIGAVIIILIIFSGWQQIAKKNAEGRKHHLTKEPRKLLDQLLRTSLGHPRVKEGG